MASLQDAGEQEKGDAVEKARAKSEGLLSKKRHLQGEEKTMNSGSRSPEILVQGTEGKKRGRKIDEALLFFGESSRRGLNPPDDYIDSDSSRKEGG